MSPDERSETGLSRRSACKFIAIGGLATASALLMPRTAVAQAGRKKTKIGERKHVGKHAESYVDMNRDNPTSTAIHMDTITHRLNVPAWWKDGGEQAKKYRLTEVFASEPPAEGKTPEEAFVLTSIGGLVAGERDKLQISRVSFYAEPGTPPQKDKTKRTYWQEPDNSLSFMEDVIKTLNLLQPKKTNDAQPWYSVVVKFHPGRDWRGYEAILAQSNLDELKRRQTLKEYHPTTSTNQHVKVYTLDVYYR